MTKPDNWDSLIDSFSDCNCPYAYIVGYYLSRFDKDSYQRLGLGNKGETHQKIGSMLEISSNTLKNFRDAFDPYHENSRKGWWQRDLWRVEKEIYDGFKAYPEEEIYDLVCNILNNPKLDFEYFFDSVSVIDDILLFPDEVRDNAGVFFLKVAVNPIDPLIELPGTNNSPTTRKIGGWYQVEIRAETKKKEFLESISFLMLPR